MASRTISNVAAELLPRNSSRKSITIVNEDTTDAVFISFERSENTTVSSTVHDFKLPPISSLSLSTLQDGFSTVRSRITAIASANTPRVAFFETTDVEP